jgi:hypothetical protein
MMLQQRRISDGWTVLEDTTPSNLDLKLRTAGWHFICLVDSYSAFRTGRTVESATSAAIALALHRVRPQCNAAALGPVRIRKYPGFIIATVTLHARQIQPHTTFAPLNMTTIPDIAAH